ncbi:MAG: carboxypeptidase M32 [Halobacteria archaeon]|nr:carboxypeptidase M32 [Halobacteria archaeon]
MEHEYDDLVERVRRIRNVENASSVLNWDQEVMMPEKGVEARAQELSTLSSIKHEILTDDETGEILDSVKPNGEDEEAVVREIQREYTRSVEVPDELVEEISDTSSRAHPVWKKAREKSDFDEFAPTLERLVELKREYAEEIDPDRDPYAVLFDDFEPYIDLETAERVLTNLRDSIKPLIDDIRDSDVEVEKVLGSEYTDERQREIAETALEEMGYDFSRGRLDTSPHPFTSGNTFDARVTTRFTNPLDALMSTIHEMGHALYIQGLPDEGYATPLSEARDLTVHESQSRLWENHVGRSRAFWDYFAPKLNQTLETEVSPGALYRSVNEVSPHPVRVESDELTYHMHIVLRFEIEKDLIRGEIEVDEVPGIWNDKVEEYLGIRPENDAEGCLQDIHWSHGSFGYFPTYSLGSVLAAQVFDAADDEIEDLNGKISRGNFSHLRDWLKEEIHRHGKRYETDDLIRRVTGDDLNVDPFVEYAEEKFGEIYGV